METRLSFTWNDWQFWTALSCFFDPSPDFLQRRFASEQIAAEICGELPRARQEPPDLARLPGFFLWVALPRSRLTF